MAEPGGGSPDPVPAGDGPVTIRPLLPDLTGTPVLPNPTEAIRAAFLRLDPVAGQAVWRADRRRATQRRLALGVGPGELAQLVTVSYPTTFNPVPLQRLLLTDRSGRVLDSSQRWPRPLFEQIWPERILGPAGAAGLIVTSREFRSPRLAQRAHPGAARRWYLSSQPWLTLTGLLGLAALIGVIALVAVLVR